MTRVLVAVRDKKDRELLRRVLQTGGLVSDFAADGEEALQKLQAEEYAMLLTDEGEAGLALIGETRSRGFGLPILVLGAAETLYGAAFTLDTGADAFLPGPADPATLAAEIRALLRRSRGSLSGRGEMLAVGPFLYNTSTLRLYKNGREILLTGRENALMKLFLDNVNRIFTKDMLYERVWGENAVDDNTIMVYIRRLRRKIEDDPASPQYIRNVRGIGYRFVV